MRASTRAQGVTIASHDVVNFVPFPRSAIRRNSMFAPSPSERDVGASVLSKLCVCVVVCVHASKCAHNALVCVVHAHGKVCDQGNE